MADLHIGRGLRLDADDAAGLTFGILAKKGAGKTYTARVMAEEMFAAGVQFVALDPTGAWWGLRSSADGQSAGLPVLIFGGENGDAPLEDTAGKLMADLAVEEGLSMVLDLSAFGTRASERRFAHDFLERLYRKNRELIHLFVDEADLFAPQSPQQGDKPLLGTMQNLIRRGRIKGIGATLITQRSAVLNKDVLTQIDVLVALRVLSPQDRDAIKDWVKAQGELDKAAEVVDSLAGLQNGESWWWAPEIDLLKQVKVRQTRTFDSSPTPRRGQRTRAPKTKADVDLDAVRERMAATLEKAKAEDPKELRKRIRELEKDVRERPTEQVEKVKEVEVPVLTDAHRELLEEAVDAISGAAGKIIGATNEIGGALGKARGRPAPAPSRPAPAPRQRSTRPTPPPPVADGEFQPSPAQQRILDALAMLEAIGVTAADKTQLALFAEASPKSSGYANNLGSLRSAGLIDYPVKGTAALTDAGRALADGQQAPASAEEMQEFVRGLVGPSKARIVDVLVEVYPDALPKEELADRAGASATSSGYTNNLGSLRSLGLIDYPTPGYAVATPVLFLEAA